MVVLLWCLAMDWAIKSGEMAPGTNKVFVFLVSIAVEISAKISKLILNRSYPVLGRTFVCTSLRADLIFVLRHWPKVHLQESTFCIRFCYDLWYPVNDIHRLIVDMTGENA